MIQFNLLPDVKQQYVKVTRTKRMVVAVSLLASAVLLVIFLLLLSWDGLQKKNLHDLNSDIGTAKSQLSSTPDLNKILTIQNQLESLPSLDQQKPVTSQLFGYLSQVTPTQATISTLNVDFGQHIMTITGDADNLGTIDTFADTLKFTTYTTDTSSTATDAFTNVVLSNFNVNQNGMAYTLTLSYDPNLFSSTVKVTLTVPPGKVTTRSVLEQPTDLFKATTNTNGKQ